MKNTFVETVIGAVVIAIATAFLVYMYQSADLNAMSNGYKITASFEKVEGLAVGSDVRMAGIKIGTVTDQRLDPKNYQAVLELQISQEVELPDDTSAKIATEGLLGGAYVSLEPGGSEYMLADGDMLNFTQGSISILDLIGQTMFNTGDK